MLTLLYLTGAGVLLGLAAWAIVWVRRRRVNGWLVGIPFSVLVMIKLRCTIDAYPCGFMSFTGGFTWHLLVGTVAFLGVWGLAAALLHQVRPLGWATWMERLGRGSGSPWSGKLFPWRSFIHPAMADHARISP